MAAAVGEERERLLDPVDRISEVLFGLIMAVTIIGSLSVATAGAAEVRTVTLAALGCNVAWGLVDAVMYVVRTATERARLRALGRRIRAADESTRDRLLARVLPDELAPIVGPDEIAGMRRNLLARPAYTGPILHARDFAEAVAIFVMVVLATFPVVMPFLLVGDPASAIRISQLVTVVMLSVCGYGLGRYAGHPRPAVTGLAMAMFGVVLIVVVKALGG
jgi:VIT1/CCC1 family predicted Fe2+/Mn2+ transporter